MYIHSVAMATQTCSELAIKHGFPPDKELVGDSLGETETILQRGAVDGSNERLAERQLVDLTEQHMSTVLQH